MELDVTLHRNSPVPLYHQLAAQLKHAVESGEVAKGTFLGNELDLADRWQVSRPTVRRAIQDLVDDGLLVRRRGVGTQVVNDQVRRPATLSSFHDDLVDAGREPTTEVIVDERVRADTEVAAQFGCDPGDDVVRLVRRRSAGSRHLAVMRNWLPLDVGDGLTIEQLERRGLYSLIKERGFRPHSAVQRLGAKAASDEEAALLELLVGAPLVTMRRVLQDDTGRVIEIGDHVYDAAHYSIDMSVVAT